jgi:membrane protein DedA with SNARE-associated domain
MLLATITVAQVFSGTYSSISGLIASYKYVAIIILMALESASLPIPSEIVLPLIGGMAAAREINFYAALAATLVGTAIGITVDYMIAYAVEKEIFYRHMGLFHVKRSSVEAFDSWFLRNGAFAVFVARILPVVRGLISFPAGFAKMPLKKFYAYSMAGSLIWNAALMAFGYKLFSVSSIQAAFVAIGALAIVLYAVYHLSMKRIRA